MDILGAIHARAVYGRRVEVLAHHLAEMIPAGVNVLDVGCGDGRIDRALMARRPDLTIEGLDVLIRPETMIPVRYFDGTRIPLPDQCVDAVMFVDVLHHTLEPIILLREAVRVARRCIILKDHTADSKLATPVLRLMDWVGNRRHGVVLPYNYWSSAHWSEAISSLGLHVTDEKRDLRLYPLILDRIFGRGLHLMVRLERTNSGQSRS